MADNTEHNAGSIIDDLTELGTMWSGGPDIEAWNMAMENGSSGRNYTGEQWKKARCDTLLKYGLECMRCGSTDHAQVDHIKPYLLYPELSLDPANLQVLCRQCNARKGAGIWIDFRRFRKWGVITTALTGRVMIGPQTQTSSQSSV